MSISKLKHIYIVPYVTTNQNQMCMSTVQHCNPRRVPPGPYKSLKVLKFRTFKYKSLKVLKNDNGA